MGTQPPGARSLVAVSVGEARGGSGLPPALSPGVPRGPSVPDGATSWAATSQAPQTIVLFLARTVAPFCPTAPAAGRYWAPGCPPPSSLDNQGLENPPNMGSAQIPLKPGAKLSSREARSFESCGCLKPVPFLVTLLICH